MTLLHCIASIAVTFKMLNYYASFDSFLFILWLYTSLQNVDGVTNDSCNGNFTKTTLEICGGPDTYLPSTYGQKALEVKPILTFLNLADFDPEEKIVTVFVSLMMDWNDTRISLNTYE